MTQSEREFLKDYNIHDYDVPLTSVDMVIFTVWEGELQVLLVKRGQHPAMGQWALPGGFIDLKRDKTLGDAAYRKLKEKTGVDTHYLEQLESFGSAERDPRGWSVSVAYLALVNSENIKLFGDVSSEEVRWVPVSKVRDRYKLAFDHQQIVDRAWARLKNKVQYTSLPINLLPAEFTLTDLQKIFEIILGEAVEKKSFRRRINDAGIIEETGGMRTGSNRPAKLFRVKKGGEAHFFRAI